jgi:hypothetical protein
MLTDPRTALTEQNTVATALTGLAGLAQLVHALAAVGGQAGPSKSADDLVHVLLGIARLGEGIARLASPIRADSPPAPVPGEWLR